MMGCPIEQEAIMEALPVQLDQDLVELLEELQRPARKAARELIVLELYRQGEVSSGRAAQLLAKRARGVYPLRLGQGIPYRDSTATSCSESSRPSRSSGVCRLEFPPADSSGWNSAP